MTKKRKSKEMDQATKIIIGVASLIVLVLALIWLADKTFSMISDANSMSVGVGFLMFIAGFALIAWLVIKVFKRFFISAKMIIAMFMLAALGSGCSKVEPGWAGIKVYMYGDQKGVEDFPIQTGRVWYNPFTQDVHKFPTFLQNVVWTKDKSEGSPSDESITFNSIEGAIINADIALSYSIKREAVPSIFVEFRQSPKHITDVYMRSKVRDYFSREASTMKVTDIFGEKKQLLLENVKACLNAELGPRGFDFDMVSFVGGLRVEDKVQGSINAVIEATQRAIEAENKVRQAQAEAQQVIATSEGKAQSILNVARAEAESNQILNASLTDRLIQWKAYEKWNGHTPQVMGVNTVIPQLK
jgi:regulator of protease activity HflC (stomatin/prohibitin superfamily)